MKKQTEEKDSEISHVAEIRREVLRTKISKRPAKEKGLKNVLLVNCRQYVSEKNVDLYIDLLIEIGRWCLNIDVNENGQIIGLN